MEAKAQHSAFYITPERGVIIVTSLEEEKVGSITIPDTMKNKDSAGVVVAVGGSFTDHTPSGPVIREPTVKIGQKIVYTNYGANRYLDFKSGQTLQFIKFNEVLGVIDDE